MNEYEKGGAISGEDAKVLHGQAVKLLAKAKEMHKGEIPVIVDSKTTIYIRPGVDPVEAVERFKKRLEISRKTTNRK